MAGVSTGPLRQRNGLPQRLNIADGDLWQQIVMAPEIVVFFDFDGTLVEIAPTPTEVIFGEQRKRWLAELCSLRGCSVGIVSGRTIDELRRFVGLEQIFYVGCHGLEWTAPDGTRDRSWTSRVSADALGSLREEVSRTMVDFEGVFLEDKGVALALHYRRSERDTALAACMEFVRLVHRYQHQGVNLELLAGKEVIEAKSAGRTKGDAIAQIIANYVPTALPIYIGDDITDESAFDIIAKKGMAIFVGEATRTTTAARVLKNTAEAYVFLRCLTSMRQNRLDFH